VPISHRNSKDKAARRRISAITIGVRHRRDLGDIGLAASIAEVWLLHPVVITPGNVLIAGERRLAACAFLRWREVPVTVVDLDKVMQGEFAENGERKDFTPSEAVAIKRAIEPIERTEAKERQAAAGPASGRGEKNGTGSRKLPTPVRGRAADKAAKATAKAPHTLDKAEGIVAAAEAAPDEFGKLLPDMDRTGWVNGPYRRPPWSSSASGSLAQGKSITAPAEAFDVVTNPPFRLARVFVEQALTLGARKTAVIFPTARLNAARWLEPLPLVKIYLLTPRPSMPAGEVIARGERPRGGRMDFAWLVFNHGHSAPPELRWRHRERSGT
jgi:ParB-like nuclease domain